MKKAADPRHNYRRAVVTKLFAYAINPKQKQLGLAASIIAESKKIDRVIINNAPAWPLEKINPVDLAVLRLAIWEIKQKKEPVKVIIDEAVELAKEFGSETSGPFVNGVLGSLYKTQNNKKNK